MKFIGEYERTLAQEARRRGVNGVICGHIHHAAMRSDFGLHYINCGDWVESCTAVVEHFDGRFEIVTWIDSKRGKRDLDLTAIPAPVRHQLPALWA